MIDVLFAHAFFLANDTKQREEKFRPYAPLATLYAAAMLRESGLKVDLFDATLQQEGEAFTVHLSHCQPQLLVIYEDSFNFLSKMCLTHVREATIKMIKLARDNDITVIVSSSDASDDAMAYLSSGAQYIILGEAENTLLELASHLLRGRPESVKLIPGIAYLDTEPANKLVRTCPRATERNLDGWPFPARDLVDTEAYRAAWQHTHGRFSLNMVTTRGCPYACTWCAKPIWGKTYAVRSAASVAEELAHIKTHYQPDHIWFADDIFGLKPGWVEAFAQAVTELDARVPFMMQTRADLMQPEIVESLAKAGCQEVWIGAESGSQKVLDAMRKGITLEHIHQARERLGQHGIRACFFIQFGYPGETLEDIEATVKLVRNTLPDDIGVSVSYPLPGTEFYDSVSAQLEGKSHWQESNDLAIMFKGSFNSAYYKQLGQFLHRDLDTRLALIDSPSTSALAELDNEWQRLLNEAKHSQTSAPTATIVR